MKPVSVKHVRIENRITGGKDVEVFTGKNSAKPPPKKRSKKSVAAKDFKPTGTTAAEDRQKEKEDPERTNDEDYLGEKPEEEEKQQEDPNQETFKANGKIWPVEHWLLRRPDKKKDKKSELDALEKQGNPGRLYTESETRKNTGIANDPSLSRFELADHQALALSDQMRAFGGNQRPGNLSRTWMKYPDKPRYQ